MSEGRLLVVDDELFVRELLQEYFTKLDYSVDIARDGEEALELLQHNSYQAALVDMKMPGMSGIELLKSIKNTNSELQVVLMTGYPTVDSAVTALRQDAFDYVIKPFRLNELQSIVSAALDDQARERQMRQSVDHVHRLEQELAEARVWQSQGVASIGRRRFALEGLGKNKQDEEWNQTPQRLNVAGRLDLPVS